MWLFLFSCVERCFPGDIPCLLTEEKQIKASRTVKGELEFNMLRHECA